LEACFEAAAQAVERSVSGGARPDAELRDVRVAGVPALLDRFV
jgi:hypothetical protein